MVKIMCIAKNKELDVDMEGSKNEILAELGTATFRIINKISQQEDDELYRVYEDYLKAMENTFSSILKKS